MEVVEKSIRFQGTGPSGAPCGPGCAGASGQPSPFSPLLQDHGQGPALGGQPGSTARTQPGLLHAGTASCPPSRQHKWTTASGVE